MTKYKRNLIYKGALLAIAVIFLIIPIHGGVNIGSWMLIKSIGIDGGEGITATVESAGKENEVIIGKGANLTLAFDSINTKEGMLIELAHCGLVVLGSELSTAQAVSQLMLLLSDGKINAGVSVVVADTSAEEFINKAVKVDSGGGGVSEYISFIDQNMHISVERMIKFLSRLKSPSRAACLPVAAAVDKEGTIGGGEDPNSSAGGGSQPKPNEEDKSEMDMKHISKTYGEKEIYLDVTETRGYDWLTRDNNKGLISIPNFTFGGVDYGAVSAQIERQSGGIKLTGANTARFGVSVRVRAKDREKLLEAIISHDAKSKDIYAELEKQLAAQIGYECQSLIDFCKREHIDLLGICDLVYKYRTKELKTPEETLDNFEIEVVPEVSLY